MVYRTSLGLSTFGLPVAGDMISSPPFCHAFIILNVTQKVNTRLKVFSNFSSAEKDRLLAVFSSKGERVGKVWVGTRLAKRVAHACGLNDYREDAPFSVFAFRLNRYGVLI
jgi:hypothetical protein